MHLEEHPHALLDDNNNVINIAAFEGHDHELLDTIRIANNAVSIVCCCDNGIAAVGGKWDGTNFYDLEGNKIPPKPHPVDPPADPNALYVKKKSYIYDWDLNDWIEYIRPAVQDPETIAE